ncbi:MAG TPA: UDP-N-acetylglucosamine 2-epimerase (non-hydrolyzing) [Saprospiraceae bacterium]|nr:UDP-N-acetylglucosamine 2-epimerase (non-hydrolyzing) [Saprospiraceae bacterium]
MHKTKRNKIVVVVGARPQFIKAAPLFKAFNKKNLFDICFVHTGQHYDHNLSQSFFEELELPEPNYNLNIGSSDQASQISDILIKLSPVLQKEKPDLVIVFGDTNSTSGATIAAAIMGIPVAHIEAGLREWDKRIPEEINKLITDALADLYFCPTQTAVNNLLNSGITNHVHLVGDIGLDLIKDTVISLQEENEVLHKYKLEKSDYYFVSCHRASITNSPDQLEQVFTALSRLDLPLVFPIHPRTLKKAKEFNLYQLLQKKHIQLIDPIGFKETQILIKNANKVLTDSGGVIKEAYFHKVPSVILDHQTEWLELVKSGWSIIAGPSEERILEIIRTFEKPSDCLAYLGNGTASDQIVEIIYEYLQSAT